MVKKLQKAGSRSAAAAVYSYSCLLPTQIPFHRDRSGRAGRDPDRQFGSTFRQQEGRDRSRDRGRRRGRDDVPRDDRGTVSRSRRARRRDRRPGRVSPYCWIFDPLDGTTNFAHGVPIFCSTLALEIDGELEVGAVYDPNRRELFTAERGRGALSERRADARLDRRVPDRLAAGDGFPLTSNRSSRSWLACSRVSLPFRAVRRLGSAALDICYVAAGRWTASGSGD